MTENVEILISSKLDDNGLNQLRKGLNDSRNDLNALARATEKGSAEWKNYKATVQELNRIMKMSDTDLKRYSASLVQNEAAVNRVGTAKGRLLTTTDKLGRSFTNLKSNVGSYSTTIVNLTSDIARGDKSMLESVGTLGLYAGGWAAVAAGIFLAIQNLVEWENTNSAIIKNRQANTPPKNVDRGMGQYDKKRPDGVGMFDYNLGLQWNDTNQQQYEPTRDSMSGPFDAARLQALNEANKMGSANIQKNQKAIEEKIKSAKALDLTGGARLYFQDLPAMDVNKGVSDFSQIDLKSLNLFGGQPMPIEENKFNLNQTLDDVNTIYGSVSSTMSLLNVSTDSFVSKIITGFDSVLTIMQTIKTINSVFSFIPFLAEGGHFSGNTPIVVGERGPELLFPSQPGYIMNNTDSMRFASNPTINNQLYLNANVDIQASMSKQNKRYNYITVKR